MTGGLWFNSAWNTGDWYLNQDIPNKKLSWGQQSQAERITFYDGGNVAFWQGVNIGSSSAPDSALRVELGANFMRGVKIRDLTGTLRATSGVVTATTSDTAGLGTSLFAKIPYTGATMDVRLNSQSITQVDTMSASRVEVGTGNAHLADHYLYLNSSGSEIRHASGGAMEIYSASHGGNGNIIIDAAGTALYLNLLNAKPVYSSGLIRAPSFRLSALNTAPANAGDTGTLGEIRFVDGFIYVCTASNTWKRVAIATW
jgi:hypothetical protein